MVVIDAVDGVKVQTEIGWEFLEDFKLPRAIFINKLDRERADFRRTFDEAKEMFQPKPIILQLPIGAEAGFKGVVDLISQKAYLYGGDGKAKASEIPADLKDEVEAEREALIENIAEADDALVERYLEGETLSEEELRAALRKGTLARTFTPVLCGSSTANIGIDLFMDFVVAAMPSPADRPARGRQGPRLRKGDRAQARPGRTVLGPGLQDDHGPLRRAAHHLPGRLGHHRRRRHVLQRQEGSARALQPAPGDPRQGAEAGRAAPAPARSWRSPSSRRPARATRSATRPARFCTSPCAPIPTLISYAVSAKTKGDEDKVFTSLTRLLEEDPSLRIDRLAETKEIILHGQGQIHIETTIERLRRKFNVEVQLNIPKVPYRETIKKKVRVQGRHKKQTGGHGQFGDCWVQFEPLPRGKGFEYVDAIVGGAIPRQYIPAVEKGIVESAVRGVLAGFPCVDFRATVDDGSFHAVDSSEMAFKIAGSLAFRKAAEQADPVLLEPVMKVTVIAPDEFMGDIMGDLNSRRGRVLGMENAGKNQFINAYVPDVRVPDLRPGPALDDRRPRHLPHGVLPLRRSARAHRAEDHRGGRQGQGTVSRSATRRQAGGRGSRSVPLFLAAASQFGTYPSGRHSREGAYPARNASQRLLKKTRLRADMCRASGHPGR